MSCAGQLANSFALICGRDIWWYIPTTAGQWLSNRVCVNRVDSLGNTFDVHADCMFYMLHLRLINKYASRQQPPAVDRYWSLKCSVWWWNLSSTRHILEWICWEFIDVHIHAKWTAHVLEICLHTICTYQFDCRAEYTTYVVHVSRQRSLLQTRACVCVCDYVIHASFVSSLHRCCIKRVACVTHMRAQYTCMSSMCELHGNRALLVENMYCPDLLSILWPAWTTTFTWVKSDL